MSGLTDLSAQLTAVTGELAASRIRWDVALEAAEVGSFDLDVLTGRLDWDERMVQLFGYPAGSSPADLGEGRERIVAEDRERVREALEQAVATIGRFFVEFRVALPDGRERWLASRGRALGAAGTAHRLVGISQDVTSVRGARDEAARLLETMQTGFCALSRDWRVTYLNAEACRAGRRSPGSTSWSSGASTGTSWRPASRGRSRRSTRT